MERELSQAVAHGIGVAAAFGGSIFKPLVGGSKFTLHEVLLLPACSIYTMNPIVVVKLAEAVSALNANISDPAHALGQICSCTLHCTGMT